MNWVYLSADKGSMTAVHDRPAANSHSYDWEGLYKNWNCLFVNLKWLSENWDSHYDEVEEKEIEYPKQMKEDT